MMKTGVSNDINHRKQPTEVIGRDFNLPLLQPHDNIQKYSLDKIGTSGDLYLQTTVVD